MSFRDMSLDTASSKYFKVAVGQNKIRVISEPTDLWVSFDKETKKASKYLDESLARENPAAKKRFAMWVIDRADGKVKMAEFGISVMRQIQVLSHDPDYGFDVLPPYDLKISRVGDGMSTEYTVLPNPKSDLTEAEKNSLLNVQSVRDFLLKEPGIVTESILNKSDGVPF